MKDEIKKLCLKILSKVSADKRYKLIKYKNIFNIKKLFVKILLKVNADKRYKLIKYRNNIFNKKKINNNRKELNKLIKEYRTRTDNIPIKNIENWKVKLDEFLQFDNNAINFAKEFFECKLFLKNKSNIIHEKLVAVCIVKNDLPRMKVFLDYYRKIGVEKFAILDDKSTDGTKEFLLEQKDVDLFESDNSYTTLMRQVWINRILEYYGYNRWYLIVDSDELLSYINMEKNDINYVIEYLEKKNIKRMRSILLDMYSQKAIFNTNEEKNFIQEHVFFDNENIKNIADIKFECLVGGVRNRVFSTENEQFYPYLTKYPLIKYDENDIICHSHYMFPYYKNFGTECVSVLRHYKFLNSDIKKYMERISLQNFAGGSFEYRKYMEIYSNNKNCTFFNENSKKWTTSKSLNEIKFIKEMGKEN